MGTAVDFMDGEHLLMENEARRRIREAVQKNRRDNLTPGVNSYIANYFGVRAELAVAKALRIDDAPIWESGVDFRCDLMIPMRKGPPRRAEIKGPLGRGRRLAMVHDHGNKLGASLYFLVWPWKHENVYTIDNMRGPCEIIGFATDKLYKERGYWKEMNKGKQWCLDANMLYPLQKLNREIDYWPI